MTDREYQFMVGKIKLYESLKGQVKRLHEYRERLQKAGPKICVTLYDISAQNELFACPWRGSGLDDLTHEERTAFIKVVLHLIKLRLAAIKKEMENL